MLARTFCVARLAAMGIIWILVATGLVLRFTVRDRFFPWAMIYYLTPIPALPIWTLIAAIAGARANVWRRPTGTVSFVRPRLSLTRLHSLFGLIFLIWTLNAEFVFRSQPALPGDLRIVFWNVARLQGGVDQLATQLRSYEPSVIALVEADKNHQLNVPEWQAALPDYEVTGTRWGGLVAVKGQVLSDHERELSDASYCEEYELRINDVDFTLLLVDLASDLKRSRRARVDTFLKVAEAIADRPSVIVGDFNTPDDSVWLAPLCNRYRQAFRERGRGYAATWPMPLPVLTIDQMWVSQFVDVSSCQVGWTVSSDHRPIVSDLSINAKR